MWLAYNYCHIASNVLLRDPDDGIVEKVVEQLSGVTNMDMGLKDRWCHSTVIWHARSIQDNRSVKKLGS